MAHLPLAHKFRIQTNYARFRELRVMLPVARTKVMLSKMAIWAGLLAVVGFGISLVTQGTSLTLLMLGLFLALVGWPLLLDARKELSRLLAEEHRIRKSMNEIGVFFGESESRSHVNVYIKGTTEPIEPLRDESYA